MVCVDESAACERIGWRKFGWSLKGAPCYTSAPLKRSERWSILPAITVNGYLEGTLIVQGSIIGEIFMDWLEHTVLLQLEIGMVLVMDNASIHRVEGVAELCEEFHIQLEYLPPYSPDYNPIESSFSCLKAWIKRHFDEASHYSDFGEFLWKAVDEFNSNLAAGWFWHCGYRS